MKKALLFLAFIISSCSDSSSKKGTVESADLVFKINYQSIGESLVLDSEYLNAGGSLSFGQIGPSDKVIRSVLLKNETQKNINLEVHKLVSPYSVRLNRCPSILSPNKSCKIEIQATARNNFSEEFNQSLLLSFSIDREFYSSRIDLNSQPTKVLDYTGSWSVSIVFEDDIDYQIGVRPFPQKIVVENISNQIVPKEEIQAQVSSGFLIRTNRCTEDLKPKQKCSITLMYKDYRNSVPSVSEEFLIKTNEASSKKYSIINGEEIDETTTFPSITTAVLSSEVEAERGLSFQVEGTGGNLVWSLISPPSGVNINQLGVISWNPNISTIGSHTFKVRASNAKGLVERNFSILVKPKIDMSDLVFNEGDVLDPLLNFSIKSGPQIDYISGNFSDFFTIVRMRKNLTNVDNFSRRNNLNVFLVESAQSSFTSYGAVKKSGNSFLNLVVALMDGRTFNYSYPISITSKNLPYFYYNVFAVKGDTQTGDVPLSVFENAKELQKSFQDWRVPIFTEYKVDNVICEGGLVEAYYGNNANLVSCLKSLVSSNAETSFWFQNVYSDGGTRQIGGRSHGARKGVVVATNNYINTLAHEYGHSLGLFHTFEAAKNPLFYHSISGNGAVYNSVEKTRTDSHAYPGDWINGRIDYDSPSSIKSDISFSGISDDTPIDYYGAKMQILNNPFQTIIASPLPYVNGDSVMFFMEQNSNFSLNSNVCQQGPYVIQKVWAATCINGKTLPLSVINNSMSYWDKYDGDSVFSSGQKQRMDKVFQMFNEIGGF